jgi:hypothetical protein
MKCDISNVAKDVELKKTWKEIHDKSYNMRGKKHLKCKRYYSIT